MTSDRLGRPEAHGYHCEGAGVVLPVHREKYGRPIEEWKAAIRACGLSKHMEIVAWLKEEHGLGHGHANALVAHTLQADRR